MEYNQLAELKIEDAKEEIAKVVGALEEGKFNARKVKGDVESMKLKIIMLKDTLLNKERELQNIL